MQRTLTLVTLAGLTTLAALAGCDTVRAPFSPPQDALPAEAYPAITLEPRLQSAFVVDATRIVVDPSTGDRPMAVQVPIRSLGDRMIKVQYEFQWFDAGGREVGRSGMRAEQFPARQQVNLKGNALTSQATGWRLEIRGDNGSDF